MYKLTRVNGKQSKRNLPGHISKLVKCSCGRLVLLKGVFHLDLEMAVKNGRNTDNGKRCKCGEMVHAKTLTLLDRIYIKYANWK